MDYSIVITIVRYVLGTIGYWMILKKCGDKPYWAAVPVAREYHIGKCAHMEEEARTFTILTLATYVCQIIMAFLPDGSLRENLVSILLIAIGLASAVYMIRIFLGLCRVFGRRKLWVVLFVLLEEPAALIWGLSKKFVPNRQIEDFSKAEGAKLAGVDAKPLDKGLTINIQDRTVVDFFKKKYLLRDIHMNIPTGHMVLLLGGSGAGKTTFVNAVTGYEKARAEIRLNDQNVYEDYASMKYDVGFVPQQDLMRGNDTVARTLADAATLRLPSSVHSKERWERVKKVLEEFGLYAVRNSLVEKLSGGQRKRLSIAMEYISDPSLFILDEPDSGLDGVVARSLFEKLRKIADEGKIVIVITHTPDRVIDLFDDVIVLAKDNLRTGRLAWYGSVEESYGFFGKNSMEEILLSINQKEEGGEGRANEFVEKYADHIQEKAG
ncbi:MAG: ABC transporter ATP-binding protein [Lachnospiraceae bacterium]|nr:ABC transporter ATP-binding protein [Lachnospiraceae bacterium]